MLGNVGSYLNFKKNIIAKSEAKIRQHEQAHKSAAGPLAGAIVIERNSEGIPTGGHVDIKMPVLNPDNPEETIGQAKTVIKSALAPADPSEQDIKVANEAKKIMLTAQRIKLNPEHKLDYMA